MRFERVIGLLVVVAFLFAACNRDKEEVSETTVTPTAGSVATGSTAAEAGETTSPTTAGETSTTVASTPSGEDGGTTTVATAAEGSGMPGYEVVHRLIDDGRETLVIVVEPGSYSNVDLENLVYDIVERFSPSAAIVVDDLAVADLALEEERTDSQQASLDAHTFLRIDNGVEVTFYGPYADFPGMTVGS